MRICGSYKFYHSDSVPSGSFLILIFVRSMIIMQFFLFLIFFRFFSSSLLISVVVMFPTRRIITPGSSFFV